MAPSAGAVLPAWCVRLIGELDAADHKATALLTGLNPEQLNWQPVPGSWSVGQCLEHLCITNELYLPAMSGSLAGKPASSIQEVKPGWFGRWFIKNFIAPSPQTKKARAPRKIVPRARVEASVLDRFLRSNQSARALVRQAGAYDVNRIRFRNPFVPLIRFTVGTGFEIIAKHQHRHLLQAERARQAAGFPA